MDDHCGDAAEPAHRRFDHTNSKRGGDRRIDGIAARSQYLDARRGGQRVHGGDHAVLGDGFAFVNQPLALSSIHRSSPSMLRRTQRPAIGAIVSTIARVGLGLAAAVLEAGCLVVWALSPQLTAIYNAEFSAAFFAHAPALQTVDSRVLAVLGPLAEPATDPLGMLLR